MAATSGGMTNPLTSQFFAGLNQSINEVATINTMTEQGFTFYNQMNDWINKEKQNASDFKMTRDLERSELIKSMGGGQPPAGGPPGGMPNIQAPAGYGAGQWG